MAVDTLSRSMSAYDGDDPQQALIEGLQAAHEEIRRYGTVHPELQGMGTTCTAAAIGATRSTYVHVGDTRLYLIRDGRITQVTRDHSYVGRLVEAGMISREEAERHPQRNILTAAVGTEPELFMDSPGQPGAVARGRCDAAMHRWIVGSRCTTRRFWRRWKTIPSRTRAAN